MDNQEAKLLQMIKLYLHDVDPKSVEEIVSSALETTGIKNIIPPEIYQFRKALDYETDRGCALMAVAFLDEKLKNLLKEFLADDEQSFNLLFSGVGGLSSFSSRIELAYLLGLISPMVRRDLNILRKVRNEFAHSADNIDFNYPPIVSRCTELYHDSFQDNLSPRQKFIRVCFGISGRIHGVTLINEKRKFMDDVNINDKQFTEKAKELKRALEMKDKESLNKEI